MGLEFYEFSDKGLIALQGWEIRVLASRCREPQGHAGTLLLGSARVLFECHNNDFVLVRVDSPWGPRTFSVDLEAAAKAAGERGLAVVGPRGVVGRAELYTSSYYKLSQVGEGMPPTLEINGIHMHRISGVSPWEDAARKAGLVVRSGTRVLDVCTGLGYTATAALRRSARLVYTVEVSEEVLLMASINPWSWGLADARVKMIRGDAARAVEVFEDSSFHAIIHDPPRFSMDTSSLYTLELYKEFHRILKRHGRLFHYTGEPGRLRGLNLPGRVSRLLREAGFRSVRYYKSVLGLVAVK